MTRGEKSEAAGEATLPLKAVSLASTSSVAPVSTMESLSAPYGVGNLFIGTRRRGIFLGDLPLSGDCILRRQDVKCNPLAIKGIFSLLMPLMPIIFIQWQAVPIIGQPLSEMPSKSICLRL